MVEGSKDNQHEKQGDQTKAEGHHVGFCNGMGSNVEQFLWAAFCGLTVARNVAPVLETRRFVF